MNRYLTIAAALLLLQGCCFRSHDDSSPCQDGQADSLVLTFTGDVLLDRGVRPSAEQQGIGWLFEGVAERFAASDAVIINLECPLADELTPLPKRFVFHADTRWADDLHVAGITHAALANNHTNDQGFQGLRSTVDALREASIVPLGIGQSQTERLTPVIIKKGQLKAALFNAVLFPLENWISNDEHHMTPCQVNASTLAQAIKEYKQAHPDVTVIAVLHWGNEFEQSASQQQRREAALLIHAGADAIIGHHPHVTQDVLCLSGHPVFFSLGNFVFDHSPEVARQALLAQLVLKTEGISYRYDSICIESNRPLLKVSTEGRQADASVSSH